MRALEAWLPRSPSPFNGPAGLGSWTDIDLRKAMLVRNQEIAVEGLRERVVAPLAPDLPSAGRGRTRSSSSRPGGKSDLGRSSSCRARQSAGAGTNSELARRARRYLTIECRHSMATVIESGSSGVQLV